MNVRRRAGVVDVYDGDAAGVERVIHNRVGAFDGQEGIRRDLKKNNKK